MKRAVIFTSKFGTTRKTAEYIANALEADIFDLKKKVPSLNDYDMIIFGSGIYFGKMPKSMRTFATEHSQELSEKQTAVFVCCMFDGEKADAQMPLVKESMKDPVVCMYLSGKQKGEPGINVEAADRFIKEIEDLN